MGSLGTRPETGSRYMFGVVSSRCSAGFARSVESGPVGAGDRFSNVGMSL